MTIDEGINKLVTLAKEGGYITFDEINGTYPDNVFSAEELDAVCIKLRTLEIEVMENPTN